MLQAFLTFLLGAVSTAVFVFAYPTWKVAVYAVSMVMLALSTGLFEFILAKKTNAKKPVLKSVITAAVFTALLSAITFLINNVILHAGKSTVTTYIIASLLVVFYTVYFVITAKKSGKKVFPTVLSLLLAAVIAFCPFYPEFIDTYRKNNAPDSAAPSGLSQFSKKEAELIMNADFYVSTKGNDSNIGSFDSPFATIEKARDAVRSLDKTGRKGITVAVMAGDYRTSSIEFTKEDSGTAECPITYCIYGDGEVVINGGITLKPDSFKKVTDSDMLSRLSDSAKEKVLCADLKEYGLTADDWGKIYAIGSYNTAAKYDGDYVGGLYCELFVNDRRQTLARYPNEGYLYTEKVLQTGYGRESDGALTAVENWDEVRNPAPDIYGISKDLSERIASWKTLEDVWMFGFWKYDWADASSPVGDFNAEKRTLSPKFVSTYGTKTDAPYYFFNVFEELDAEGEWYLDRENGIIYLYADGDLTDSAIDMSVTEKPVITVNDCEYITFDGFTVKGTRSDGITAVGNNLTVQNCLIKNVAGNALSLDGYNNLAYANEITRTGKGGISINGGDRETLTAGNSKADNNLIHDWSEIYQTYQPAVTLGGVGNICSHNEMFNSPHEAITYGGNNHIIEYNNIHDVCLLTDDAGAIYAGRRWDFYGTVIRYNAVYNLGSDGHRPCGIYMDDALSGQTIYGNLLINVPSIALHLGGGRDLQVKNNIVVNCNDRSISYDDRAREGVVNNGWFTHSSQKNGDMWQLLFESPWQTETWKKAYPQMQKFSDNFDDTDNPDFVPNPAYSDVSSNIIVNLNGELGDISDAANRFSKVDGNLLFKTSESETVFENPDGGNYKLKNAPDGFEQIPFDMIGRY